MPHVVERRHPAISSAWGKINNADAVREPGLLPPAEPSVPIREPPPVPAAFAAITLRAQVFEVAPGRAQRGAGGATPQPVRTA
jgi:hypothetical protein